MEVEQAEVDAAGAEAVLDVRRHREERAGADTVPLAVLEELDLALEDVERVGVVGVGVRVDALEIGPNESSSASICGSSARTRCLARSDPLALAMWTKYGSSIVSRS